MTNDQLISVSAAMLRCNLMFELWSQHKDELLKLYPGLAKGDTRTDDAILIQPSSSYLILGIALLFVVIECLQERAVSFPETIRRDVEAIYPKLKQFRNCVFHTQAELLSSRQFALLDYPNSLEAIFRIRKGVDDLLYSFIRESPDGDIRLH